MSRDVDRRVELQFGGLVEELLDAMDNLDLALEHVNEVPEAEPLARGVELARKRFLEALERHGVEQVDPEGDEFDPNEAEAMQVEPVSEPEMSGRVTRVLRPGYRLGERVIRPARVAVGRHD
jgi:molecular chaperone GrpE (heat shock protein)